MAQFAIRAMTSEDAAAIATWRYPEPYSFYDSDRDPDDLAQLLDPAGWGVRYFAADIGETLAGFFEFTDADDVVEIGLGLRPDLTGQGLGGEFLAAASSSRAPAASRSPSPPSTTAPSRCTSAPDSARPGATPTSQAARSMSSFG